MKRFLEDPDKVPANYKRMLKHMCETSPLMFNRFFFKVETQNDFLVNVHHWLLARFISLVYSGHITRGIVTMPPRYSKTMMCTQKLVAHGLALNPEACFVHTSFDKTLALDNSRKIKDIIQTEWYQQFWPIKLRVDTKAKGLWRTSKGGGLLAAAAGGGVTGFGAGLMDETKFTGALIIDDPLKPDDAFSDLKRDEINYRFVNTFKSRLALEQTPIILVMQRLHEDDAAGFLLRGGTGEKWHHLNLPVEITDMKEPYNEEYTHGMPIRTKLPPGALWPAKHNMKQIQKLKVDQYTFDSQYMQAPSPLSGGLFKPEYWKFFTSYDSVINRLIVAEGEKEVNLVYKNIYADTAMKKGEHNDFTVFLLAGKGTDGNLYLLDLMRGKYEDPELKKMFLWFCEKHEFKPGKNCIDVRSRKVEDKVSGTGLIQYMNNKKGFNYIEGIPRNRDKVSRAKGGVVPIAEGRVLLPRNATWLPDYLLEHKRFTVNDTHKHDDMIDVTLDAIDDMIINDRTLNYAKALGKV